MIVRRLLLALSFATALSLSAQTQPKHRFDVAGDHFELDGKPFQVISGEMHYARIPREYWRARLQMARAMGLNTIATYVFWNVHEPRPGVYDFSGNNDLAAFIRIAQEEGLKVILRAGPYSCAEWEFGGFPAWLLKDPKMSTALRTRDPAFMVPVERWMKRLAKEVGPLQIDNGGPIIATQVENEYGNFSNDHQYMQDMRELFLRAGFTKSMLYTVDPSKALANGSIDGVFSGVNFGTGRAKEALGVAEHLRPGAPLFATEYWPGWFDLWGHPHETRPLAPQLGDLDYTLSHGGSINIYMVHGGSSFGMMAGASESTGAYRGNVTSYDYDAPIDEAGHPTAKFFAYRDVILKYTHETPLSVPPTAPVITIAPFKLRTTASLASVLPKPIASNTVAPMEQFDQAYGYILYQHRFPEPVHGTLSLEPVHDYAQVYLDGKLIATADRHYPAKPIALDSDKASTLTILVENTGRLNSTKKIRNEWKGLTTATLNGRMLEGWQITSLPMAAECHSKAGPYYGACVAATPSNGSMTGPHFAAGTFTLSATGDAFLDVRKLGKGLIWVNGHPLGRFWNIGPQGTLYVPGPWLRKGRNEVVIFDLFPAAPDLSLCGLAKPILDAPTPTYDSDPERSRKKDDTGEFGKKLAPPA